MSRARRRVKKQGFLTDYTVEERYLLRPDRARGKPAILRAIDPEGRDALVKFWPRPKGVDDLDLEDIWRSEIRQLHRLAAMPKADDLFVQMINGGKDPEGFYLVFDPGQGSPLEIFQKADKKPALLAQPRLPRNRRILWANLRRLAEAVELLHSQGAIHRNIDPWAVVTTLGDDPDFKMTGFEWSMRVAEIDDNRKKKVRNTLRDERFSSFTRDWRDLAHLSALILDIPPNRLGDAAVLPSRVVEHASAAEIKLLRTMLGMEPVDRLDGDFICARIDEILENVIADAAGREAKLCLAVRLGPGSGLSDAIRQASGYEIEISDHAEQLRFISDDLGTQPQLLATLTSRDDTPRYSLMGRHLTYRITPFRQPGTSEMADWEFAGCERADMEPPDPWVIRGSFMLDPAMFDIVARTEAARSFPRRRGRVQRWDEYLSRAMPAEARKTDLDSIHQAFALLLVLEMAYAAADVFPVEILSEPNETVGDNHVLRTIARNDSDRTRLSDALKIEAPAVRLTKILESDDLPEEGAWILSETGVLGEQSNDTAWQFIGLSEENSREVLKFESPIPAQIRGAAFLVPEGMVGRTKQFKRRVKALGSLREHTELLRMLADQRGRIEDSHDPLDESEDAFKDLDPSKQDAVREIVGTIPLFMLQGPPGVGKTFLVGDLVRRRFDDEPTTRMLLSAQSNSAIDHLMNEVQPVFADTDPPPVMIRARAAGGDETDGDLELDQQANRLLLDLNKSKLVEETTPAIRKRISALAASRTDSVSRKTMAKAHSKSRKELRAFEGMILRAANLVFATTNSAAVERLLEERGLFDWTIIEEASKATGGELLGPLLLSHRRLMIGDHKQLPPFDADKMTKILAEPSDVKASIAAAKDLISRYLKDPGIDDIFEEVKTGTSDFGRTCSDTLAVFSLFENFVEKELARQKSSPGRRPIARRLEEQHRMHPAIARIVSRCFYDGALTTFPKKEEEFLEGRAPFISTHPKLLPELPIIFIDLIYAREAPVGERTGDKAPPWSNPDEVAAAMKVLELIRPLDGESTPSLAILSPYRKPALWQDLRREASLFDWPGHFVTRPFFIRPR